jgi:hypothetical protein
MKAPTKTKPSELPESDPFMDGLLEYMDSPEGELSMEAMDRVVKSLQNVQVDAQARKLLWADGKQLCIDASVKRIHAEYPEFPAELIEDKVISWLDGIYAPEGATQQQVDELDRLTEEWISDHNRGHRRA